MKAITIARQGKPVHESIRVVDDWPEPECGAGQALIRTLASTLNRLDIFVGQGVPGIDMTYPRISGSDACGIVEGVGAGVDQSWVGQRVILNAAIPKKETLRPERHPPMQHENIMFGEHFNGAHCERFVAPIEQIEPVGNEADPVQAAAFALVSLTAWRCLVSRAGMKAGDIVLIPGIGGGVATAGLAIARHLGCTTIVTSRHQWKLDKAVSELGADHAVLDTGQDWSREVRTLTGKRGVDIVLDSIGKATHLMCIKAMARGATYVTPGCTTGPDAVTDLARIFWNQLRIVGSSMGTPEEFAQVTALFRAGHIKPVIDQVYEVKDAAKAWERLEKGEQFGKVVIRW